MSTTLETFFSSLQSENDIDQLVQQRREEDLYLEFKEKERRNSGELGESDKENFSQALSGFANAAGGVLIFGVETRRSADGIDQAYALKPITAAATFRSRLQDSILATTQPTVDGVLVEVVPSGAADGYVKC
jgi:predicted HTH transcriptional regulator